MAKNYKKLLLVTEWVYARLGISETKSAIEANSTPILQNHLLYEVFIFWRWQKHKLKIYKNMINILLKDNNGVEVSNGGLREVRAT